MFQGSYTPPLYKQYEFNAIPLKDNDGWKVTVPELDKATFNVTNDEFDNFKNKDDKHEKDEKDEKDEK